MMEVGETAVIIIKKERKINSLKKRESNKKRLP